jgi:hypothetical protein
LGNKLILYFIALGFFIQVFAQRNEITVTGFITDLKTGEEIIPATVLLYKDSLSFSSPPLRGTFTNSHGFYALSKVTPGGYILIARSIGYKIFIREISLKTGSPSVIYNIAMAQEDIQLPEFTVKGERENRKGLSEMDISYDLLKKLPSLSGETDIFKSLQLLPGIKTESEMSSGLYIRGGSPDQNLTLVDGAIMYSPTHMGNFSSSFNSAAVQNLRLIKGAFPAEYGGRLSSVLDIKLRSGTKEKNRGELGLGLINSYFILEGPLTGNSTYMISGRKMYYDFFQNNFNSSSIAPRYNFADINSKITFSKSESDVFSLSAVYSEDKLANPSNLTSMDYDIQWSNTSFSFNWLKINSKSLFINSSFSYVNFRTRSILIDKSGSATNSDYFASSDLKDFYVKSNVELNWNKDNVFKTGIELAFHNYKLNYSEKYNPLLETDPYAGYESMSNEAAMFFQNEWSILDNLKTNAGGRFYYFKLQKYFRFEPRLSIDYFFNDNLSFTCAYSSAHQFLHLMLRNDISLPTDLWYPADSKIEPCKANQYSFGVNTSFLEKQILFSFEGYYKEMFNLYEFSTSQEYSPGEELSSLFTKGKGEAYGAEFFINKTDGNLSGWIGYTLSWTRRLFSDINAGRIFYPRYDRRHDISIMLTYSISDNFNVGADWQFASGQGYTVPSSQYSFERIGASQGTDLQLNYTGRNNYKLKDYHKLDISLNYTFRIGEYPIAAYLMLYNVYNRSNPFAAYFSAAGTTRNINTGNITSINGLTFKQMTLFPFTPSLGFSVKF